MRRFRPHHEKWCYKPPWQNLVRFRQNPFLCIEDFRVTELATMVSRWQSLYPYKVFASPEFIILRESCSICGEAGGPWSSCNHRVGTVYGGRLCFRTVQDMRFCGIALVLDPVQKYSVIIPSAQDGSDPMDYRMVEWVCDRIKNPFAVWQRHETSKIYPHDAFVDFHETDGCPCSSGMAYRMCCRLRSGVMMPHTLIEFTEAIAKDLQSTMLVRAKDGKHSVASA